MMQNDEEETQRSKSAQETEEVAATRLIITPRLSRRTSKWKSSRISTPGSGLPGR